jgi:hypothetical protein
VTRFAAFDEEGTLMNRKIGVLVVAAGPSAIALIAAAFVSLAGGSLSSSGPPRGYGHGTRPLGREA